MATSHSIPAKDETKAALDRFSDYLLVGAGYAPTSANLTVGFIRRMAPAIGLDPSREAVQHYLADMLRGGAKYANLTNTMKAIGRYMEFIGRPLELTPPKKPKKAAIATLSEGKIAVMIFVAPNLRVRSIIATLAYTGIRNDELIHLRVRDLDMTQQSLTVEYGKGAKGRVCCISGDCLEILAEYLQEPRRYAIPGSDRWEVRTARPEDLLFVTERNGGPLQTQDVRKWVRILARKAGIDSRVWPHLFRHSFATALVNRGARAHSVQALLGHSHLSTTLEYYLHPTVRNTRVDYARCVPSFL